MGDTFSNDLLDCKFCLEKCSLEGMVEHYNICSKAPVSCPNNCGKALISREKLQHHIENECSAMSVPCQFKNIGCLFKAHEVKLKEHYEQSTQIHMALMANLINNQKRLIINHENEITSLKLTSTQQTSEAFDPKEISALKCRVNEHKLKLESLKLSLNKLTLKVQQCESSNANLAENMKKLDINPSSTKSDVQDNRQKNNNNSSMDFDQDKVVNYLKSVLKREPKKHCGEIMLKLQFGSKMLSNQKVYKSNETYTVEGYKYQGQLHPSGVGDGADTHMSLYVEIIKGEYDWILFWPLKGTATFILLDGGSKTYINRTADFHCGQPNKTSAKFGITKFAHHNFMLSTFPQNEPFTILFRVKSDL